MHTPDVEAEITLLAEGGRLAPARSGYRPAHKVRGDYLTTGEHHYFGCDQVFPGQTVHGTITFITPDAYPHCLRVGCVIDIQEGGRLVGHARITRIMNALLEANA